MLIIFLILPCLAQTKEHRHAPAAEQEIPKISVVRAKPGKNARRSAFARGREFEGFSVYEAGAGYRIFFLERRTRRTYEIRGVGLAWRPFSALVWKDARTLIFDCWGNPRHGTHYEFDAKTKRLKKVLLFSDTADSNEPNQPFWKINRADSIKEKSTADKL